MWLHMCRWWCYAHVSNVVCKTVAESAMQMLNDA